jgi:hypothetical protein
VLPQAEPARCLAFARAWGYDALLTLAGRGAIRLLRVADGASHALREVKPDLVRRLARGKSAPRSRRAEE